MNINITLKEFKTKHIKKKNQIIFHKIKSRNNNKIENIINNFLKKKNSFIFESVEKQTVRGRYTIMGSNPDKIWEFNGKKIHIIQNNIKKEIKANSYFYLKKLIEKFNFPIPKSLPQLSSLLVGYFSYDIIRYIEKVPDNCVNDLNIPDIRLMRPKTLIIYDNLKKNIFLISNCFCDEKINNYEKYYKNQIDNINNLKKLLSFTEKNLKITKNKFTKKKIKIKSNISKKKI